MICAVSDTEVLDFPTLRIFSIGHVYSITDLLLTNYMMLLNICYLEKIEIVFRDRAQSLWCSHSEVPS